VAAGVAVVTAVDLDGTDPSSIAVVADDLDNWSGHHVSLK